VLAAGTASAEARRPGVTLEGLRLADVAGGRAVVLRGSAALDIRPTAGPGGRLARITADLPQDARIGAGVPRVLHGPPPIARVRIGVVEGGRLRLVVDLVDASEWVVRTDQNRRQSAILVRERRPAASTTSPPALVRPPAPPPVAAAPVRGTAVRRLRVVLDAGHGGDDPGAVGYVVEKHVTLDVVRRLARRLREDLGADVQLTRSSDATVPLAERTAVANQSRGDLFVSVHANSNPRGKLRGVETYVLDNTADHATLRLAAMENGTDGHRYQAEATDLRYILSSLVQGGKMDASTGLASAVHGELVGHMRARYPDVVDLGLKRGPFYVLVGSHMPCILVETAFVSHPVEGRRLGDEAYRAALADGLFRGIRRFAAQRARAHTL
jgi:N-acetylmuramoyl-L-alanine amidase